MNRYHRLDRRFSRSLALAIAFLGTGIFAACKSDPIVAPITAAALCARQDTVIADEPPFPNMNFVFDGIGRLLPGGFAGLAVDAVFLQEPALADTARKTAAILAACPNQLPDAANYWRIIETAPVVRTTYSWLELRYWLQQMFAGGTTGMASAGIDVLGNRVAIEVVSQQALDDFHARAQRLKIPDNAISLTISTAAVTRAETASH